MQIIDIFFIHDYLLIQPKSVVNNEYQIINKRSLNLI